MTLGRVTRGCHREFAENRNTSIPTKRARGFLFRRSRAAGNLMRCRPAGDPGIYHRINAFNLLSQTDHDSDCNDGNNRENQGIFHEGLPPATSGPPQSHRHPHRIKKNRPFDFDHATHLLSWMNPKGMA
jgi:hypothetical protein